MNFNFGEALTRAWQIVWKHKILWVFGILAGCGSSSGSFNLNFGGGGNGSRQAPTLPPQAIRWFQFIEQNLTMIIIVLLAVMCIFWTVGIFLSAVGKIGLIRGTAQAEGGAESLAFGELFSGSVPYFWRMFGLSLILSLPAFIVAVAVIVIVLGGIAASGGNMERSTLAIVALIPVMIACMCLLIPVMFVLGMIFRQAENAVVLENMGILPSIARGWEVFKANLIPIILMAIILGVIGLVVGIIIAIPIFVIVFPTMMVFVVGQGRSLTPLYLMGGLLCIFIPIVWVIQGIAMSYVESAWTLTYMRLTQPQDAAPVIVEANAS